MNNRLQTILETVSEILFENKMRIREVPPDPGWGDLGGPQTIVSQGRGKTVKVQHGWPSIGPGFGSISTRPAGQKVGPDSARADVSIENLSPEERAKLAGAIAVAKSIRRIRERKGK